MTGKVNKMDGAKTLCLVLIWVQVLVSFSCTTGFKVRKTSDLVVDDRALTIGNGRSINGVSFQQHPIITHTGYQYVGYYNDERHVCIARRKLPETGWEILEMKDYSFISNDRHNVISMGICADDGTIHIAFDHHNDTLHYRVSKPGVATNPDAVAWDANLFSPVTGELEKGKTIVMTYPRFWQTPDGGLQFCYRRGKAGNGDRMIADYNPQTKHWENTRQIDSKDGMFEDEIGKSDRRCSYPNGYDYDADGRLHTTWVWREPGVRNHDLMYAYSLDQGRTWRNSHGDSLDMPLNIYAPGLTVIELPRTIGLTNTNAQAIDSHGRIHAVVGHCSQETLAAARLQHDEEKSVLLQARRYHHYWREKDGIWQHRELPPVAGNRPKLFIDKKDNAYLIYGVQQPTRDESGKFAIDIGDLVIVAGSSASRWEDWKIVHVEKGPFVNEMLGDLYRWKADGTLSVMVQGMPAVYHESTPLRVLDFKIRR